MMLNCDPRDRFEDDFTFMIDPFSCTLMCTLKFKQLYIEMFHSHISHFDFAVIFVMFTLMTKLPDFHYNQCFEECAGHILSYPRV